MTHKRISTDAYIERQVELAEALANADGAVLEITLKDDTERYSEKSQEQFNHYYDLADEIMTVHLELRIEG